MGAKVRAGVGLGGGQTLVERGAVAVAEDHRHADAEQHDQQHGQARHGVFQHLIGPKIAIAFRIEFFRMNAVLAEDRHVQHEEADQERGQHAGVQREEARQRMVAVFAAADHELLQGFADEGDQAHEARRHAGRPIAALIPREQIAGERQAQDDLHQNQAEPEIEFARRFICAVDHHLKQVERQQHDHGLRHVMVQPAQQPAELHLVLDVIGAFPGRLTAGAIGHPEKQAGDHLHGESKHERAAPDVAPARAAGHSFVERFMQESADAGAIFDPAK